MISIHAPPRGATRRLLISSSQNYFNSRPSARGDACCGGGNRDGVHFNSRPSARGDGSNDMWRSAVHISIHAPPRGATSIYSFVPMVSRKFQFTPLREGRQDEANRDACRSAYFNSRPSARGDAYDIPVIAPTRDFNSRPSARGDSSKG